MALKNVKSGPALDQLTARTTHARSNLMLSLMVYSESQSARREEQLNLQYLSIIQGAQKSRPNITEIRANVDDLAKKFSDFEADDKKATDAMESFLKEQGFLLREISQGVYQLLAQQSHGFTTVSEKMEHLLSLMDREVLARRRVLDSLYFDRMNERRNQVSRAHGNTYQWIFAHNESRNAVWDDFLNWLCRDWGTNMYWICGKPGCGKSTLMRELDEQIRAQKDLEAWIANGEFVQASCYFWHAGTDNQKSLMGLLHSLVYQLFEQRPDLIDKSISASRWEMGKTREVQMRPWEENELVEALRQIVSNTQNCSKILLIIDGLDEYDGTDEQRENMLGLFRCLTDSKHVKACLASRPWNIFRDFLEHCPQLRLEDLTRSDICCYVRDKLMENGLFRNEQRRSPELLENLSSEIVAKAQGVFLWVRLVVRDLLRMLRDGGRANELSQELQNIPPDLNDYFRRMMESIPPPYRKEASMILQTALCSMNQYLLLSDLYYIQKHENPCFAASPDLGTISDICKVEEDTKDILDVLDRKLTSRCMGLLEIDSQSRQGSYCLWQTEVIFLHRTVRDFLSAPSAQRILLGYINGHFDVHLFWCNVLVTRVKDRIIRRQHGIRFYSTFTFLRQIQARPTGEEASFVLFEYLMHEYSDTQDPEAAEWFRWLSSEDQTPDSSFLFDILLRWHEYRSSPLSLAIQLRWHSYIASRLMSQAVHEKRARPILDYALCPNLVTPENADPWIVNKLLAMGAHPNDGLGHVSIWGHYLLYLPRIKDCNHQTNFSIISMLLQCSASRRVTKMELKAAWSELKEYPGKRIVSACQTPRSRCASRPSTIHGSAGVDDSHTLDVLELLLFGFLDAESKLWIIEPQFSDDDMARLEDMLKEPFRPL